jgi:hypothetical protein
MPREAAAFAIFAGGLVIQWSEPTNAELAGRGITGDRCAAYRASAEALHARIVARTGLDLREITTRERTH